MPPVPGMAQRVGFRTSIRGAYQDRNGPQAEFVSIP
jgi:hypothetical protein